MDHTGIIALVHSPRNRQARYWFGCMRSGWYLLGGVIGWPAFLFLFFYTLFYNLSRLEGTDPPVLCILFVYLTQRYLRVMLHVFERS